MFEKPQSTHVLGLSIDAFSLKGAAISQTRGKLKLEKTFDFLIQPSPKNGSLEEDHVKPLYTTEQAEELKQLAEHNLIVTSANTQDILVRPLELKLKKDKDIEAALAFQVEPLLPYPAENAIIDKVLLSKDKEGSKLTVFAMRKDHLKEHLAQWDALEIEPEVISASPQALVLFTNHFIGNDLPLFIVHIGLDQSFGVLVDQGKLLAAQAIPDGVNLLIDALAQDKGIDQAKAYSQLIDPSFHPFQQQDKPAFKQALDNLRMSITRTIYSLAKQFKSKEINSIIVTGPGALVQGIAQNVSTSLNKTLLVPREELEFGASSKELLNFALPIGEALSALPQCKDQINFRQQDFLYPEPWKRLKQPIFLYFMLCLGIAIALFLFGKAYVSYQEGELKQQYLNLLSMMNKPYTALEKELNSKKPGGLDQNSEIPEINTLSLEEIKSRLAYLEKDIQSTPQTFPLQANVPLVSDVLAWISSHPNFINKQQEKTNDALTSMRIENFSYSMVKRPEPTKKQDRYQVKVEMEFSSPTPKMAREFHDALIAPNDMVDPKGEIKWNSNRDRYRTSFYLKDKTVYPNL